MRRSFIKAVRFIFLAEMFFALICAICFVLGFVFSMGREYPVLETVALVCAGLLVLFEIIFIIILPIKLLAQVKEVSAETLLIALTVPIVAFFVTCIFYGTAHF